MHPAVLKAVLNLFHKSDYGFSVRPRWVCTSSYCANNYHYCPIV